MLAQTGYPGQRMWCPVHTWTPPGRLCLCVCVCGGTPAWRQASIDLCWSNTWCSLLNTTTRRGGENKKGTTEQNLLHVSRLSFFTAGLINRSDLQSDLQRQVKPASAQEIESCSFREFSSLWMKEWPLHPKTNNRNEKTHMSHQDLYWYPVSSVMELQHAEILYVRIKKSEKILSKGLDFFTKLSSRH